MRKTILILAILAGFTLVGCSSNRTDGDKNPNIDSPTIPGGDGENDGNKPGTDEGDKNPNIDNPTIPGGDSENDSNKPGTDEGDKNPNPSENTLTLKEVVAKFEKIIEAIPETETPYGINNDLKKQYRSETFDETKGEKYINITDNFSKGSVSIGENMLRYKNSQINGQISSTENTDGKEINRIKYDDRYEEELFEKLDTTGFGFYKCIGKEKTIITPKNPNNPDAEMPIDETFQIDGKDKEFTSYVTTDVSSTLESATFTTLYSFLFLGGDMGEISSTVEFNENVETKTQTYTFNILDEQEPSEDTKVYKDVYDIKIVLKNGLLANFEYKNDFKFELNNGYKEHSLITNLNTIESYTKIVYPDTTGVEVATDILNVTPWGEIILGFEEGTDE